MKSLKTIAWYTRFVASLVPIMPKMKKCEKLHETEPWQVYKPVVDDAVLKWMTPIVKYAGVTYDVKGTENIPADETVLFVCNHSGMFDFPAVLMCLEKPCPFIAKKEAAKIPIVKNWMTVMDCVFIDRDNAREAVKALNAAAELITDGRSVVIFPEGTRSKDGQLGEFKNGGYKIAQKTGCKVVPVLIENTRHALEETGNVLPTRVKVTVLEPIETKDMPREESKHVMQLARDRIRQAKDASAQQNA